MVIGKLDITVYFHIIPVDLYIIPRWFTYLIDRKSTPKTYPSAKIDSKNVPKTYPGCLDRGAVKLYQNHCLAKWIHFLY